MDRFEPDVVVLAFLKEQMDDDPFGDDLRVLPPEYTGWGEEHGHHLIVLPYPGVRDDG